MTTEIEPKPIVISGRPRYAEAGTKTKITVQDKYRNTIFVINGGYLESRSEHGGEFVLAAKHDNGTDFEHDSAYVVMLEGAGLMFNYMTGTTLYFKGVVMKGSWYDQDFVIEPGAKTPHSGDTDEIYQCDSEHCTLADDAHLIMPFTPPKRKFKPFVAEIVVEIGGNE